MCDKIKVFILFYSTVDMSVQRKIAELVQANIKDTGPQIFTLYMFGEQKSILDQSKHQSLMWMSYNRRRAHKVLLTVSQQQESEATAGTYCRHQNSLQLS